MTAGLVVAIAMSTMGAVPAAQAHAAYTRPCADVEAVFARGSGQLTGAREAAAFDQKLQDRLKPVLTTNTYELGLEPLIINRKSYQFPAVPVNGDLKSDFWGTLGAWMNAGGAKISSGGAFKYGDSVNKGVDELSHYLELREQQCKSARFVVGGYSQGAEVIGEAFIENLSPAIRGKIVFNSLFGDPRLFFPEGKDAADKSRPACYGSPVSEYRRGRVTPENCIAYKGSLGGRDPYAPNGFSPKAGLWCNGQDFVCGTSRDWNKNEGHGTYAVDKDNPAAYTPMDEAMDEIAKRLKAVDPKAAGLVTDVKILRPGTTGLDVVFLIDSTGSMGGKISQAREFASTMSERIKAQNGRVALVEYRDFGDEPTAVILSKLNPDLTEFQAKLDGITVGGGGDTPEGLLYGLMTALNGLDWKWGATKAAVVLTDADFHDPDLTDGITLDQVAKRSLEIDPVNIYPVVPSFLADSYAPLAEATSGKVILDEGDSASALSEALARIEDRPVALLGMDEYTAPIGATVTYSAATSYAMNGTIASYEWDINGDGTFEASTATPVYEHSYAAAFEGVMQVRIKDTANGVSSASAKVHVGRLPAVNAAPAAPASVKASTVDSVADGSEVEIEWTAPADPSVKAWMLKVNGVIVGGVGGAARSATITDVQRAEDVEFEVLGVTAAGEFGEGASAVLPALAPAAEDPVVVPPAAEPSAPPASPEVPKNPPAAPVQSIKTGLNPAGTPNRTPVTTGTGAVDLIGNQEGPIEGADAVPASGPTAPAVPSASAAPGPSTAPAPAETRSPEAVSAAPAAGIGVWPWALGILLILGVAAVSFIHRRRNST